LPLSTSAPDRHLPSFPTRRSSDLSNQVGGSCKPHDAVEDYSGNTCCCTSWRVAWTIQDMMLTVVTCYATFNPWPQDHPENECASWQHRNENTHGKAIPTPGEWEMPEE